MQQMQMQMRVQMQRLRLPKSSCGSEARIGRRERETASVERAVP